MRARNRARRLSIRRAERSFAIGCLLSLSSLGAGPVGGAAGAETQWWISSGPADYAESESRGVVVSPDGTLELGPNAVSIDSDSLATVWAVAVMADGSVALAGDDGRIERWTEAGGIRPWVRLPVGQVLSLAADGDGVVAGTGPEGRIYRVGGRGDTTLVARTDERYVWGLVRAGPRAWYAATGTRGRLLRVEGESVRVVLDSDESNLVSLASDGAGGAYAGGDSRGRVVHVRADGTSRTLFDAPEGEVRGLAVGPDGALYAAGLGASAVTPSPAKKGDEEDEQPGPTRTAVTGGKAVVYRIVPDSSAAAHWDSPQPFVFALASSPQGLVAATGNRAGVYLLERAGVATQWLSASQGQITALAVGAGGRLFAGASNPGALWRIGPGPAARGEMLSSVLDAKRIARFGRIRWWGDLRGGRLELWTRSGNTERPDTTWSAWQGGSFGRDGFKIGSPPARYLQWKLVLIGGRPRVESVEVAWREQNLPPRLEEVVVAPQGQGFREGDLVPRPEPITQTLPSGQKVEYSVTPNKTPAALRDLPMWARGLRTVQWKGSDPNQDPLVYRADARAEPDGPWIKLGEDLNATSFTWDTGALPDGRYRLRVIASDRPANPIGEDLTAEALSKPFTVDNTPPAVVWLDARGEPSAIRIAARARDELSPLSRIQVAVDDGDWRTVSPEGGLADDRELTIRTLLEDLDAGQHTVSVRAVDLAGNAATRATRVNVPAAR